ncbi:MAG: YafY family transcriptional regulator [Spirochaetes bacterium]|nr:YafY family transcriptional regulator [Spirochaetota bacterium]
MKIDRLLAIIVILLNRDRISAKELASKFEVNLRTIYRDIDSINMAGIPIISYPGNNGGFGIMENFKISHQLLSLSDMSSILSALSGINRTLDNIEIETAIEKINTLVPEYHKQDFEENKEQIVLDINPWGMNSAVKNTIKTVHKAIIDRNKITIGYIDSDGNKTERTIEPMSLILMGYSWYLFAYCLKKSDFRLFKVSRIRKVLCSNEFFKRKSASYKDYLKSDMDSDNTICIKLKIDSVLKNRMNEYFDDSQIEKISNDKYIATLSFPDDHWVTSFLLGLGENAEILEPDFLRNRIKDHIAKMNEKYNCE